MNRLIASAAKVADYRSDRYGIYSDASPLSRMTLEVFTESRMSPPLYFKEGFRRGLGHGFF